MTQGSFAQTGNTLDVAIQGSGWFQILMPDGTFSYTRDGSFQMDNQGRIVTAEGNLVQPTITVRHRPQPDQRSPVQGNRGAVMQPSTLVIPDCRASGKSGIHNRDPGSTGDGGGYGFKAPRRACHRAGLVGSALTDKA